ncbi:MAG: protein TolR [Bdellovibrionota bacterium]
MAGGSGNYGDGPVANINVTPLVDVMLVLLVIFMVTAPMMQQGVEVNLPKVESGSVAGKGEQLIVSVNKSGEVFLGAGNKLSVDQLASKLKLILEKRAEDDRKVFINGDQSASYGQIMEVMGGLYAAGIYEVGLLTDPPEES